MGSQAMSLGFVDNGYNALARYADVAERHNQWNSRLIDDENGRSLNNASGSIHYDDHRIMLQDVVQAREYTASVFDTLSAVPGVQLSVNISDTLVGYMDRNQHNAQTSMNGSNRKSQETNYAWSWVPQPIVHSDFHIQFRQRSFSYKAGDGISASTIAVMKERDRNLVLGNTDIAVAVDGTLNELKGLTNSAGTLLQPGSMTNWADPANKGLVYDEMVGLLDTMFTTDRSAQTPNSVFVFVANDIFTQLMLIVAQNQGSNTMNIDMIKNITAIKDVMPNEFLADGSVLLVEATPETYRIPMSQDITVAPWNILDPMGDQQYTVFTASTLQVRQDRNGRSGVSYATKA